MPDLWSGDEFYMRAFDELSTCRQQGAPIPWRDIIGWAEFNGLDAREAKVLVRIIRSMDDAHQQWTSENQKS